MYQSEEIIELENGKEYIVIDKINKDGNTYYYLASTQDNKDLALVKEISDNNEKYLSSIESDEEFDDIMIELVKNNKDKIKEILN